MAYKDSDYTVVIAYNFGTETLTLVVEIQALCHIVGRHNLLERSHRLSLPIQFPQKSHKESDHTVLITDTDMLKLTVLARL